MLEPVAHALDIVLEFVLGGRGEGPHASHEHVGKDPQGPDVRVGERHAVEEHLRG